MKPLIVLIITFLISVLILKLSTGGYHIIKSGNIALCCMLILTAIGHFKFTQGMAMMLPDFIPSRTLLIYITGILEFALAIGFLFPKYRYIVGIIFIVFLVLTLPANIYAAMKHVDYETATYTGKGLSYLWFRVPMQIFLIIWTLLFCIKTKWF